MPASDGYALSQLRETHGLRSERLLAARGLEQQPGRRDERPMGRPAEQKQKSRLVGRARRRSLQPPAAGVPGVRAEPHPSRLAV